MGGTVPISHSRTTLRAASCKSVHSTRRRQRRSRHPSPSALLSPNVTFGADYRTERRLAQAVNSPFPSQTFRTAAFCCFCTLFDLLRELGFIICLTKIAEPSRCTSRRAHPFFYFLRPTPPMPPPFPGFKLQPGSRSSSITVLGAILARVFILISTFLVSGTMCRLQS